MKIFKQDQTTWEWRNKVNFVDENNVVLGYDLSQCCCETAGWFLSDSPTPTAADMSANNQVLKYEEEWSFDPEFFQETKEGEGLGLDSGAIATFRIVNGVRQAFIHLYNCHNGYYSHGFEFTHGRNVIRDDSI